MSILHAIIYGIIQGLTEWLPVSSTAHLDIAMKLLNETDADTTGAAFTAVIQLGTTLALFIYFWKDLSSAIVAWAKSITNAEVRQTKEARIGWAVFYGTIPVVIAGILLKKHIEGSFRSLWVVVATLIIMGVGMLIGDAISAKNKLTLEDTQPKHGWLIGCFQALAIVPGMSRSGSTITGGFFAGFDRVAAARLSFLMSVPSVTLAGLKELYDNRKLLGEIGTVPVVVSTIVAFIVGYATIAWLLKFIATHSFRGFVWYRFALAAVLVLLITQNIIKP